MSIKKDAPPSETLLSAALGMKEELEASLARITKNTADAQDLFQGVLQRALERTAGPKAQEVAQPEHYLRRSARNAGIDWTRKAMNRIDVVAIDEEEGLSLIDPRPGPEETTAIQQQLDRMLSALPAKCREVFRLVKIEGHSYAEAAQLLGIADGTVKSHLKQAALILARIDD